MHEVMLQGHAGKSLKVTEERHQRLKRGDIVKNIVDLDPVDEHPKEGSTAFRITSPQGPEWVLVTYYLTLGWMTRDEFYEARQTDSRTAP